MSSDLGKLSGRHVVRIILNASPPSTPHDERRQYKSKKKFSQSTSSLDNRTSQLDPYSQTHSTSRLPSTQQVSTSEDQLEMAKEELRKVTEEKEAVEEERLSAMGRWSQAGRQLEIYLELNSVKTTLPGLPPLLILLTESSIGTDVC